MYPITQDIFSCCFTNQLESKFEYTFDNIDEVINDFVEEIKLEKYNIYVHDYGAPVGFRLATIHPERIQVIITQNGNA
jgi:pimeloyl-ACP methyl ester carboxylesterase